MNWAASRVQGIYTVLVDIHADDFVAQIGEYGPCDQSDISTTDNANVH